MHIKKSDQ